MKRRLFFILLLVCLILPFNVLALEFYKGNSYTGYENLDLFSGDVTSTPDGGYIVFGNEKTATISGDGHTEKDELKRLIDRLTDQEVHELLGLVRQKILGL